MSIRSCVERILNEWPNEIKEPFKNNKLADFIRSDFANEIGSVSSSSKSSLMIKASAGAGTWASVPWLALLDPQITTTTQKGIYPVYLFRADGSGVYLSLGQGTTEPNRELGKVEGEKRARSIASELRRSIPELSRWKEGKTDLRSDTILGKSYETPNIGARLYEKGALPSEEVFRSDLIEMLSIYEKVTNQWPKINTPNETLTVKEADIGEVPVLDKLLPAFENALSSSGFRFNEELPLRVLASLSAKPFLLLTGLSGSGKTKIAQLLAHWLNPAYRLVAVGADWTSNENLLGYPDALNPGHYCQPDSGVLELILFAAADPDNPYFLILDEMNLSHVERYFADFLSAMESKGDISLHDGTYDDLWDGIPGKLSIPKNLFVIGTVNVDETTYMFSPKVLDRANVIEFRISAQEMELFLSNPIEVDLNKLPYDGENFAPLFAAMAKEKTVDLDNGLKQKVSSVLMEFFPQLKEAGAEFGYRTAHEICRFVYFHKELSGEGWEFNAAMDAAIMQKLLPKLHGSKKKLGPVLAALIRLCLTEDKRPENDPIKDEVLVVENAIYPTSLEKLARMRRRLAEHGFTSFAEA